MNITSRKAHTHMNTINFAVQIYSSIQQWPDFVINFSFFNKVKIVTSVFSGGILQQFCTNLILTLEWLAKFCFFFSNQTEPYIVECKKFWPKLRL